MSWRRPPHLALFVLTLLAGRVGSAEELRILPGSITLSGSRASQPLLVEAFEKGVAVGDRTNQASFSVENPGVVTVRPDGRIEARGNGETELTARTKSGVAKVKVSVRDIDRTDDWSFKNHVEPILTKFGCNSGACHGAAAGKNGFRLTLRAYGPEQDYDVLTRQALARRIVKTAPAESLFLLKPTGAIEHAGGIKFTTDSLEYRILAEWIGAGLPGPSGSDPAVRSLQVEPSIVRLRPGDRQNFLVQATYADGRVVDVTRWSKFATVDASVAKVDDDGHLQVEGQGEAVVTVWYDSHVTTATVTVPYPGAQSVADAPAAGNLIDIHNGRKLRSLGIPASPDAGDAAFLRRASLDATGSLPSVAEVDAFLADKGKYRREKLVDRLLNGAGYVDYWSYKWSDLFLVSSKQLPPPALWSFSRFIRKAVESNLPWDKFAREIVTAKGSTLNNGAANYYVLHRDPIDLTESASMAFLGLSLTCARCHNHPMEKWTQDQYYGMANLFSRVQLKDGVGPGDVIVVPSTEGDIRHPRSGQVMSPQPLDAKALPVSARGDRREAFADWLAEPSNPYFDRAIINRVWRNFFGRGLIDPEDDLRATNPPSDQPLMDSLVADFRANGRDIKKLIRLIMTSAAYARSSDPLPANASDAKFLSHWRVKRLPAEVLLDAIASVTGVSSEFKGYPGGLKSLQLPDSKVESGFLDAFGRPIRESTCSCERSDEPSITQALHLTNGNTINEKLRSPTSAVSRALAANATDEAIVDQIYKAALSRLPSPAERSSLLRLLAEATRDAKDDKARSEARRQAVEDLYWGILTSKEFLFNH